MCNMGAYELHRHLGYEVLYLWNGPTLTVHRYLSQDPDPSTGLCVTNTARQQSVLMKVNRLKVA